MRPCKIFSTKIMRHGWLQTLPALHVAGVVYRATWLRSSKATVWAAILVSFMFSWNKNGLADHNKKSAVSTNQKPTSFPIDWDQGSERVHVYPKTWPRWPDLEGEGKKDNISFCVPRVDVQFTRALSESVVQQPGCVETLQAPQACCPLIY